jgi:hypothetical protein
MREKFRRKRARRSVINRYGNEIQAFFSEDDGMNCFLFFWQYYNYTIAINILNKMDLLV